MKAIDTGMRQILIDLNYIKTQHSFTFPCQVAGCKGGHPAQLMYNNRGSPCSLLCSIVKRHFKLPQNSHLWDLQQNSANGRYTQLIGDKAAVVSITNQELACDDHRQLTQHQQGFGCQPTAATSLQSLRG